MNPSEISRVVHANMPITLTACAMYIDPVDLKVRLTASFEDVYEGHMPTIERVIYNPPATIVFWSDKTKTVVKCTECSCISRRRCHANVNSGLCEREDGTFIHGSGSIARGQWGRAGLYAAIAKKAWGGKAPSIVQKALESAEWVEE